MTDKSSRKEQWTGRDWNDPKPRHSGRLAEMPSSMGGHEVGPMGMIMMDRQNILGGESFAVSATRPLDPAKDSRWDGGPFQINGTKNLKNEG